MIVAPFTASAVLSGLFLAKLPVWVEKCFLVLGKHSTNIRAETKWRISHAAGGIARIPARQPKLYNYWSDIFGIYD